MGDCADHIRRLLDYAERTWEYAVEAAQAGHFGAAEAAVAQLGELPTELTSAYSLWELCLVDLYNDNPSEFGVVGDMISGFETWLATRR